MKDAGHDAPGRSDAGPREDARSRELEDLLASGSAPDIDALMERLLPGLTAFIRLRAGPVVRARESASDIAQSVCRDALEHIDRFQHGGAAGFKSWLYTTATRLIQDRDRYWRRQRRDVAREVPMALEHGPDERIDLALAYRSVSSPSMHAMGRESLARVEAAFDTLSESDREVIGLARLAGLSHREVAEATDRTEGACRVALNRALARLSTALTADDGESTP